MENISSNLCYRLGYCDTLKQVTICKSKVSNLGCSLGDDGLPSLISNFAIILLVISLLLSSSRGQALQLCRGTLRGDAFCSSRPSWQERKL